jgi:DMSO reductase family type II enzyme molybdopterin subunit
MSREDVMKRGISRRSLLKFGGASLLLSLSNLSVSVGNSNPGKTSKLASGFVDPHYQGYEDIYRKRWKWDKIAKSTHFVNCWYQRNCSWNVYVKEGVVWREEQAGIYEPIKEGIPDYNPRGCQKGACYSHRMYDANRLTHPLKRVGKRGEGKWKRVTWEEALNDIADHFINVITSDGPGAITFDPGTAQAGGAASTAPHRLGQILDTPLIDVNSDVGDHHPGAQTTVGKIAFSGSMDDLFYSDLILIWGGNPSYTQIPNAHFINEARYNGAKVICIAPDYNASSIHADRWIGINPGSDAAFSLSLVQVMMAEKLINTAFIREQTDMPFLVRRDNGLFLRGSDIVEDGSEESFYLYDEASKKVVVAPQESLQLHTLKPALEGKYRVETRSGWVEVTTVFAKLKEQVNRSYRPEQTQSITGIHPDNVRTLAREIAKAKAAICLTQSSFSKYYHAIEMERCQILVLTLAGQIGKKGSGITGFPALTPAGGSIEVIAPGTVPPTIGAIVAALEAAPTFIKGKIDGKTNEKILYQVVQDVYRTGKYIPGNLYYYHAGLQAWYGSSAKYDPTMKRELSSFLEESYRKGWQIRPPQVKQRILFAIGGNILRRARVYHELYETLLKDLDLLVTCDWRMSNTALHSDYVLPAAGWYEKDDILWATPLAPYIHIISRAVEPVGESKPEWSMLCLLLKTIQQRAKKRNIQHFTDRHGKQRNLDEVYDLFTHQGRFTENNPEAILDHILSLVTNLDGIDWAGLKKKGFQRVTEMGMDFINIGNATDVSPNETITANTWHTDKKEPWPTLTGRIQFYIDHPYYLEQGEELPVHKDSPAIGGNYPLMMVGAHTRWSIHAAWRDSPLLLQLGGRGEPTLWLNAEDAARRKISDNDRIKVYNDIGSYETIARVVPITAARASGGLPRMGALPVQEPQILPVPHTQSAEPAAARGRLLPPATPARCQHTGAVRP